MEARMDADHKSSAQAVDSDEKKVKRHPFLSRLIALARTLFNYPELIGWSCLVLALLFLFIRLGLSDDNSLGRWITSDTLYPVNVFTDVLQDGHSLSGWKFTIAP